jgi:ribose transport system substrate-binding protein
MKHFFFPALALIGAALLSGCSSKPDYKYLVVFSQCNNAEPYRAAQNAEMKRLWGEQPDVKLVEMDAQQDSVRQIAEIETAIRLKPQLLIVAPNEGAPLTDVMGRAMKAGIKVICLERDIVQPNYTSWISADNRAIGELLGNFVVDYLKQKNNGTVKGRIVELAGLKGNAPERDRKKGADDVWAKYPGITIVTEAVANWSQSLAKDRMTEILAAVPNIDVVFGRNDPMAVGAYLAAKEKGREKEMIFVGIDGLKGDAGGIKKVQEGILAATCIYPLCVDKAVEVGTKMLRDPSFVAEKQYIISSQLVTPANAAAMQ